MESQREVPQKWNQDSEVTSFRSEKQQLISEINYVWMVNNFAFIEEEKSFILSPSFSIPNSGKKWFMKLLLHSKDETTGTEYVGIQLFLQGLQNNHEPRAKFKIAIMDSEGNRRFSAQCKNQNGSVIKASNEGYGFQLRVQRALIMDPKLKILRFDNTLQIVCKISIK